MRGYSVWCGMKRRIGKILLLIAVCFLIGDALAGTPDPVRLFVKEVPLKLLGKELNVIAIEQGDGTQGYFRKRATESILRPNLQRLDPNLRPRRF